MYNQNHLQNLEVGEHKSTQEILKKSFMELKYYIIVSTTKTVEIILTTTIGDIKWSSWL